MAHAFKAEEVLFSPTSRCNLHCAHCTVRRSSAALPVKTALRFLRDCARNGIRKIGFTGGEPFLRPSFLYTLSREAVKNEMIFGRVMTNGVWFKNKRQLYQTLHTLFSAGFDGELCLSIDAFHPQRIRALALFIRTALAIWKRADIISIACVTGARDTETKKKLNSLAMALKARVTRFGKSHACLRGKDMFIKILPIALSPVGRAHNLLNPWDGRWFTEDYCQGPGHVFNVMANGDVSPCCGYACEEKGLIIGNIHRDSVRRLYRHAQNNVFVRTVFEKGLHGIRKGLQKRGMRFPGRTSNNCYFCWYCLTRQDTEKGTQGTKEG